MNGARTIGDCIESIKRCEYPKFEIMVVDGRSNDDTVRIAQSLGVRVFTGEGRGRAGDINIGFEHASGDIIAITDDDCVVDKRWLEEISECFEDPSIGFAGGPSVTRLDRDTRVARVGGHIHDFIRLIATKHGEDSVIGCNSAYRRSVLSKFGGFDGDLTGAEDTALNAVIMASGYKGKNNPKCIVYHRRRFGFKQLLRQFWLYGKWMGVLHNRDRKALKQRSKQIYFALAGILTFTLVVGLSLFYASFWVVLVLLAVYVSMVLGVHYYLAKKTGYGSNAIIFVVVSTVCILLYIFSFLREQVFPKPAEYHKRAHASEWDPSRL